MWPDRRLLDLFKIEHPIVLAPMAGAMDFELAAAVAEAGGLASLPFAMLNADQAREQIAKFRERTRKPVNVNFFCHTPPQLNNAREARWRDALKPYYEELGIDPSAPIPTSMRMPFDAAFCDDGRGDEARSRELPFRTAAGGPVPAREGARLRDDVAPPPRSPRRAGSRRTASTSSSRKVSRPAAIAACSCPTISPRRSAPSRWCRRSSTR